MIFEKEMFCKIMSTSFGLLVVKSAAREALKIKERSEILKLLSDLEVLLNNSNRKKLKDLVYSI